MKKIFSVLVVSILIISTLFLGANTFINTRDTASAETGAPPLNGTTGTTWLIEAFDNVFRANEDIQTADISFMSGGSMSWKNVTCNTAGNITVQGSGSFNLKDCTLTLTGNLTISGTVTLENTTIKMNPSQNGEYNILLQNFEAKLFVYDLDSDPLTQNDNSLITSAIPDGNHRYNFWVEKDTQFIMKNSELSQCGFDNTFQGLTIRTNNTLLENCTIINNYIGVTYEGNTNNSIINCNISQNNDAGIRISDSAYNNEIKNCEFNNNQYGIVIYLANNNQVSGCDFADSSSSHIYIHNSSNNDFSSCDGVLGMHSIELSTSSINNNFNDCNMEFNAGDIVYIYESKDNVFTDCNFTNGLLNGVSLSGASNNKFIDCNISKNLGWGIYIYSNQDEGNIILNSVVSDNIGEGVRIESSASRNRIISSKISNNSIGIYLKSSSGIDVLSTNITSNTNYGLYFFTGARNNILSTNLSYNPTAIYFTKKSRDNYINDSVIYSSSFFDLMIEGSSNLTAINTIFSRNDIDIKDSSNVTVKWYLNAKVEEFATGTPLENAVVSIMDAIHSTYHSHYNTDDTGWTKTILPTETFIAATSIFKHTPHRIRASKSGYEPEIQDVTIDTNLDLIFRLKERVQPLLPDFIVDNISISNITPLQNQDITINVTILNNGTANLTGQDIFVKVIIDNNTTIHGANISSLLINSYEHVITNWIVNVTNGSHVIRVEVDVYNSTFELNETNNNMTKEIIVNTEPIAVLYVNRTEVTSKELIEFDARFSTDEVLEIVAYLFDFGDGNTSNWTSDTIIDYGYGHSGTYFARLRVRDASGLLSKWTPSIRITVANRRPIAGFTYSPEMGYVTTLFEFMPNGSFDPDGIIVTYLWDFGDGTNSTEPSPTHTFPDDVGYNVSLIVTDDNENSTFFEKIIIINNLPPNTIFKVNKDIVHENDQIIFDATKTFDFDDDNITQLNYSWDFKDGNFENGRIVRHSFEKAGVYNVTLTVTDDDEAQSEFAIEISVNSYSTSTDGILDEDLGWILAVVGLVVFLILFVLIFLLVIVPRKRKRLEAETSKFVTTGKLDFVILKKPGKKDFRKFELHGLSIPATIPRAAVPLETTETQALAIGKPLDAPPPKPEPGKATHMGIYWKTTFLDSSWVIYDNAKGDKSTVTAILNNEINLLRSKNWDIDYAGNGTILPSKPLAQPLSMDSPVMQSSVDQDNI